MFNFSYFISRVLSATHSIDLSLATLDAPLSLPRELGTFLLHWICTPWLCSPNRTEVRRFSLARPRVVLLMLGALAAWAFACRRALSACIGHIVRARAPACLAHCSLNIDSRVETLCIQHLLAFWTRNRLHCHCTASRPSFTGAVNVSAPRGVSSGRSSNNRDITTTKHTAARP